MKRDVGVNTGPVLHGPRRRPRPQPKLEPALRWRPHVPRLHPEPVARASSRSGRFELHAYGLMLALGVLVAAKIAETRWTRWGNDPTDDRARSSIPVVIAGVIGARDLPPVHRLQVGRRRRSPARSRSGRAACRSGARSPAALIARRRHGAHQAPRHADADGRDRARPRCRAGDRSLGQLVQPGALRPADESAVGARDRSRAPARRLPGATTRSTRRSSTSRSGACSSRARSSASEQAVRAAARAGVRALRRAVHLRAHLLRGAARRPRDARSFGIRFNLLLSVGALRRRHRLVRLARAPAVAHRPPPAPATRRREPADEPSRLVIPVRADQPQRRSLSVTDNDCPPTTTVAARAVQATKIYGAGRDRGARARRRRRRVRAASSSPRSWARRARASRRCCTASPASTASRAARCSSATSSSSTLSREGAHARSGATASASSSRRTTSSRRSPRSRTSRCRWRSRAASPTRSGSTASIDTVGPAGSAHAPAVGAVRRSAAARRGRARAREPARDHLRRRADRQPRLAARARRSSTFMRDAVDEFGQTIVMVTHDPIAAAYADRVVFLADGRDRRRDARARPPTPCSTRCGSSATEPADVEGHAQGPARAQAALRAHRPSRSSSASRSCRARSCSPRRSRTRSTTCSPTSTKAPTRVVRGVGADRRRRLRRRRRARPSATSVLADRARCRRGRSRRRRASRSPTRRSSTRTARRSADGPVRRRSAFVRGATTRSQPVPDRCRAARPPATDDEIVIDKGTADEGDLEVGRHGRRCSRRQAPKQVRDRRDREVRDADSALGASIVLFTLPEAQRIVDLHADQFGDIGVVAESGRLAGRARRATSRSRASRPRTSRCSPATSSPRRTRTTSSKVLSVLQHDPARLRARSRCSSACFIIYNTFSIIVAQRTREMALLRAIGASRRAR